MEAVMHAVRASGRVDSPGTGRHNYGVDLLLSIQPVIAQRITSGKKKYEYRRAMFKKEVRHIYLYSSSPVRKIVCRFKSGGCLSGTIDEIWQKTGRLSAAREDEYREYFEGTRIAYAILIEDLEVFDPPFDPYALIPSFRPPQSFMYINGISPPGGRLGG